VVLSGHHTTSTTTIRNGKGRRTSSGAGAAAATASMTCALALPRSFYDAAPALDRDQPWCTTHTHATTEVAGAEMLFVARCGQPPPI